MSWRTGSTLFLETWPLIQARIADRDHRIEFTGKLIQIFVEDDMDPYDIEDVHPEIRAAMRQVGIEFAEPERWENEETD